MLPFPRRPRYAWRSVRLSVYLFVQHFFSVFANSATCRRSASCITCIGLLRSSMRKINERFFDCRHATHELCTAGDIHTVFLPRQPTGSHTLQAYRWYSQCLFTWYVYRHTHVTSLQVTFTMPFTWQIHRHAHVTSMQVTFTQPSYLGNPQVHTHCMHTGDIHSAFLPGKSTGTPTSQAGDIHTAFLLGQSTGSHSLHAHRWHSQCLFT